MPPKYKDLIKEIKIDNLYEVYFVDDLGYKDFEYAENIFAETRSKARYKLYKKMTDEYNIEWKDGFRGFLEGIRTKRIGTNGVNDLYGSEYDFKIMTERRDILFAEQGMMVNINGKYGIIVGSNTSCNLDVYFPCLGHTDNCHPWWEATYYDKAGEVIKDFKEAGNDNK